MITELLAALTVGAALAMTGGALQSVLRNPLAEPYMLGLVGGAGLFAAAGLHFGFAAAGSWSLPACAFAGACAALALVCAIAHVAARRRGRGGFDAETVILAGFVTGSFAGSLQMTLLTFAAPDTFAKLSKWLFGDLHAVRPVALAVAALCTLAAGCVLYRRNRALNALALGEEMARALGVDVRRTYAEVLLAASLMTAVSVSLAGAIGFLGLVAPHAVRRFAGANHRVFIPACAGVGALFLLGADAAARALPGDLSAGVVCALAGGPYFLYLLCRKSKI